MFAVVSALGKEPYFRARMPGMPLQPFWCRAHDLSCADRGLPVEMRCTRCQLVAEKMDMEERFQVIYNRLKELDQDEYNYDKAVENAEEERRLKKKFLNKISERGRAEADSEDSQNTVPAEEVEEVD
jgi:hypothetical protein